MHELGKTVPFTDEHRRAANAVARRPRPEDLRLQFAQRAFGQRLGVLPAVPLHHRGKAPHAIDLLRFLLDRKARPAFLDRQPDHAAL